MGGKAGTACFAFNGNDSINFFDLFGLLKVCCRSVDSDRPHEKIWRHCEIKDNCVPEEDAYEIWTDKSCARKMDNGKPCCCVTKEEIQECLRRHPYSAAPRGPQKDWFDYIGNNCQASVILSLGNCCLRSNWKPNWYAGNRRGRCLEYEVIVVGESALVVCIKWELPDWYDSRVPKESDPRVPELPGLKQR